MKWDLDTVLQMTEDEASLIVPARSASGYAGWDLGNGRYHWDGVVICHGQSKCPVKDCKHFNTDFISATLSDKRWAPVAEPIQPLPEGADWPAQANSKLRILRWRPTATAT